MPGLDYVRAISGRLLGQVPMGFFPSRISSPVMYQTKGFVNALVPPSMSKPSAPFECQQLLLLGRLAPLPYDDVQRRCTFQSARCKLKDLSPPRTRSPNQPTDNMQMLKHGVWLPKYAMNPPTSEAMQSSPLYPALGIQP